MLAALVLAWLAAGAVLCWLMMRESTAVPAGPPPDPYAGEVASFRRELHDWDRG